MNYYKELPAGYHAVREIDAVGNKKFAVGMNLAALPLMLVSGAAAWLLRFSGKRLVLDNPMSLGAACMALCALLAPFVLFSAVFIALICLCDGLAAATAILLFAVHFGGCAGDLYDTFLLLFRLRGDILMRDTGPKQTFYARDAAPHA